MKLYLAISGDDKQDVLRRLRLALENPKEFEEDNCSTEEYDESKRPDEPGRVIYQLDYDWDEGEGSAYLADLYDWQKEREEAEADADLP